MKFWRAVPAGVVDSGLASLATFVLNLFAIATWESADPTILGTYFLYMTAFVMASTVPTQLLYIPGEKVTLEVAARSRGAFFGRIARLGVPVAAAAGVLVLLATLVGLSKGVGFGAQLPFLVTAGIATVFSPLQNHARRLLHLAERNWEAAAVSLVQVVTAAVALLVLVSTSIDSTWIPIGALAIANIISVTAAAMLLKRRSHTLTSVELAAVEEARVNVGYKELAPAGRWLVATGVVSLGNNFLVESAVFALASPEALALAGSAKTVAQPILVLANGLRSVLGPPSMEAARSRDRAAANRVATGFGWLTAAAVVGYLAIAGFSWVGNPLARLVDSAYTVPLLVALSIVANGLNGAAFPGRLELIGAGLEKRLFIADLRANLGQLTIAVLIAAAVTSPEGGSFARPVAFAALGAARIFGYSRQLGPHYASPPSDESDSGTIPPEPDLFPPAV